MSTAADGRPRPSGIAGSALLYVAGRIGHGGTYGVGVAVASFDGALSPTAFTATST